jgi:hypothetical protein
VILTFKVMSTDFFSLVSTTITTLSSAKNHYNIVKDDKRLPAAFHEAGQGLLLIEEALQRVEMQLNGCDIAGDSKDTMSSLEACNSKAKLSESIFIDITQAQESERFEGYKVAVRGKGKGNTIEVLVIGIMNDVCDLAKDNAIELAMKPQVKPLREAIERLSKMEPSMPNKQSGNFFSSYGSGNQFNATGGTQNNNTGSGNQFPGANFSGTVHFGSNP